MKTVGQRIEERRIALGLTKTEIWKAAGKTSGAYSQWMNGGGLAGDSLLGVANVLKVTPRSLESGRNWPEEVTDKKDGSGIVIDQYHDVRGAMGDGVLLRDQPGQITGWKVTKEWVSKNVPHNTGANNLRIVTGFGDSMRGMFNSGDPLIVDIGVKSVEYDGVYFFRVGEEGFIKRLQRIPGDGIRALSENKAYESWTIKPEMDFEVFGRVLKVWQSEEF
jgi:phage repressor protein C with HTH and peptisase S24 domain